MPAVHQSTHNFVCALVLLPDQGPWSLDWELDYVCKCVQQSGSAVNSFINKSEFEATRALSGCRAGCGKHQFHAKMTEFLNYF